MTETRTETRKALVEVAVRYPNYKKYVVEGDENIKAETKKLEKLQHEGKIDNWSVSVY